MKVAIVHDWLVGGGAERVVLELHRMFPDAPIYTSYCTPEWRGKLDDKVVTGYLQWWPFSKLRRFIPFLRIWWFTRLDFSGYDLVISSSGNGEAKGVKVPDSVTHICYCHSPTHFYWRHYDQYMRRPGFGLLNPIVRIGLKILVGPLRRWDYRAAQRPHHFIANSNHIQADIKSFYDRDSVIIYPPVDTTRFTALKTVERKGFVTVGRQVAHKHTDVIVAACTKLELPLTVVGRGPEHDHLAAQAGPTVQFVDNASDEDVARYMARAEAFLFASFEDFGVTPVEAMAAGTPVIAFRAGGALDYVIDGKTGLFFDEQTPDSLVGTLKEFPHFKADHDAIRTHAKKFDTKNFTAQLQDFIKIQKGASHE